MVRESCLAEQQYDRREGNRYAGSIGVSDVQQLDWPLKAILFWGLMLNAASATAGTLTQTSFK